MAAALSASEAWLGGLRGGQRRTWWAGRWLVLEGNTQLAWSPAGCPGGSPPPGTPPQAGRRRQGQAGGAPAAQWQLPSPQGHLVPGQVSQRGTQRQQGRQAEVCGRGLCEYIRIFVLCSCFPQHVSDKVLLCQCKTIWAVKGTTNVKVHPALNARSARLLSFVTCYTLKWQF